MRYRHVWPGVLLLSVLALLLSSLLLWGDHFLTPSPAGGIRRLLQVRVPSAARLDAAASEPTTHPIVEPIVALRTDLELSSPASDRADSGLVDEASRPDTASSATGAASRTSQWLGSQTRYALELGTFAIVEEAERAEAQLNQAGFSTVRFRQQTPARLYTVAIRQLGSEHAGQVLVDRRLDGMPRSWEDGSWVAKALPLRSAVLLAERLRSVGYDVQIAAEAVEVAQITLRHGNFVSRQEAETVSRQISGLGVPNEVVSVR